MLGRRVLISTLIPNPGGVTTMVKTVLEYLREREYEAALAYYMPYRMDQSLSVPIWRLLGKSPIGRKTGFFNGALCYELGVRLPEFEWARYVPSKLWKDVISSYDYHIAVSGHILPALPILSQNKPCLAWIATPYYADKADRSEAYSLGRRILDVVLDTPVCRLLEKKGLRGANILAISSYTANALQTIDPQLTVTRMPVPIDTHVLSPNANGKVYKGRIGFLGRLDDPRKNVRMLIDAINIARKRGFNLTLHLAGANRSHELRRHVATIGLQNAVEFLEHVELHSLKDFYQSLDVFAIPSRQEGLGIVGLEAMACGCPVVSTRCGGTEEYIIDGGNGFLVNFDPVQMANAICRIVSDSSLRQKLSNAALQTVKEGYEDNYVREIFWTAFERTFKTR